MTLFRSLRPLVIFLLLGGGVFALERWRDPEDTPSRTIEVTASQLQGIRERWTAQWGRPPAADELRGLVEDAAKEEILYREALRLGLDRDDTIVRRRLAQKMAFLLEDVGAMESPTEDEVEAYHVMHAARYREPIRTTFTHVFLSDERRPDPVGDARVLLRALSTTTDDRWRQLGDPFMLRREYAGRTDQEIADLFGRQFTEALPTLGTVGWQGPIPSAYGTHLVRIVSRTTPREPSLDEVRHRVVEDLVADRRRGQNDAAFAEVRARYELRLPAEPAVEQPPEQP